jgi:DNA (cytosine-5)-methyltransferase 1
VIHGLDLFSGIGGISLALAPWVRTIAYCENDRYAQGVLLHRMRLGDISCAPIWDDIRTLKGDALPVVPDIMFGGFPCQDISVAGHGRGLEGERSGLFIHVARLAEEIRPSFIFLENVPAIRTRGLSVVCFELARLGYDLRWTTVSAAEVGAKHKRRRWFLLAANPNSEALRFQQGWREGKSRCLKALNSSDGDPRHSPWSSERLAEPRVSRAGDGIPFSVDRDRGLGNAVVPLQARTAFKRLMGLQ